MSIVLSNQVEASERSARQLEQQLATDHSRAMFCLDVEALMESIVCTAQDINHFVERWQDDIKNCNSDAQCGTELFDLYVRLEKTASRTASLGKQLETEGFRIAGKKQFLNAWRKLKGIVSLNPNRVAESFAQIRRGDTVTLEDLENELSHRPGH